MNSFHLQNRGQGYHNYYTNDDRRGQGGPPSTVYQIDFNAVASGKMIAMTKRHIKWRFGFPNQEALDSGKQGIDCRGEEHDVTLIWSVVSGKRMLMSNGRQMLVDVNKGKMFEHTWINHRGNTLRMVVYSSQPMSSHMGNRQYDLFIDGVSFFVLPKLYEVGLRGSVVDNRIPGQVASMSFPGMLNTDVAVPQSEQQEKEDLQRAIQESLEESRRHLITKGKLQDSDAMVVSKNEVESIVPLQETVQQVDLLDLFYDPVPTVQSQALVQVQTQNSQYQLDPFMQTSFQGQTSLEKSFPTGHGDTVASLGHQPHTSQSEMVNYATNQTNVTSSQHNATAGAQYSVNPFETFGETSFAAPVSDSNVNNTNFTSMAYSVQATVNHPSHNFVQHEQHQMQYYMQNQQTMQTQTQNNQYYAQTSQPYHQQNAHNFDYNHHQYQAP